MEYHSGGSLPLLGRPRYCPGANSNGGYLCETGHCCGETGCCTYYYELWWFWLLWTVLILFSCCCAYRHRRAKLRVQQQQRQREISLLAYHGANSYPSSMLDLSFLASLKLPSYEEVAAQPSTPPPPYSSVFTTPRYPQPPRAVDPHLLTQHDPLLHRPLSDGPSSLSSDNSSSCSCDSCCPSSPCSSSLSAPVTYETDTSHASTPSEATPLTLDVTMETIAAAATCLEVNEARFPSERVVPTVAVDIGDADAAGAQEPVVTCCEPVTVAVVTRAASSQSLSSPGTDVALPVGTTSPIKQQLDLAPCSPIVSTCNLSSHPNPNVDLTLPSIQIISTDGPEEGPKTIPAPKIMSGPSTPTVSTSDSPTATKTLENVSFTRTFAKATIPTSPVSVQGPDGGRTVTMITGPASLTTCEPNLSLVPISASSNCTQTPIKETTPDPATVHTNLSQGLEPELEPAPMNLTLVPQPQSKISLVQDFTLDCVLNLKPAHSDLTVATDAAPVSSTLSQGQNPKLSPGSSIVLFPASPRSGSSEHPGAVALVGSSLDAAAVQAKAGPSLVLSHFSDLISPMPSDAQASFSFGSAPSPKQNVPTSATSSYSSCPAINIESETSPAPSQSPPSALSPSSPPCLPSPPSLSSPPALPSASLPAPALLLDPLTALHQSDKGGSGHASSLSPSPRATQSPPKQTLFSPCVDVFEPGPPNWEDGEEEQEEVDNDDDEDEDMGADESQYRHRRLTGDSGIEVCRCRVEEEEEEEEEEGGRKEDGRRGGGGDKGNTDLHDSVDCPARGQMTTGEGLTLCNPTSTTTPTAEDNGKVVIVMETV